MPMIARTAQIDDDGSGTTGTIWNNAWKTELYGQIDGALGTQVPWAPTDQSGAGLSFTGSGFYTLTGLVLHWWAQINYPSTANSANAIIGGLPGPVQFLHSGAASTFGPAIHVHTPVGNTIGYLLKSTGAPWTNVELSGALVILQGSYYFG